MKPHFCRAFFLLTVLTCGGNACVSAEELQRCLIKSVYGERHELEDFQDEQTQALVLVFIGIECPVSSLYMPRLRELHEQFRDRGVRMLAIYPDARVNLMSMATHAHDHDLSFPALQDEGHRLADQLNVQVVPEVVLLDANLKKQYQGAIDNQFKRRGRKSGPTESYLEDAIQQLLAGQPVTNDFEPASGCPIERQEVDLARAELTFHRDIEPLIQKHCQTCHRTNGAAPFELMSYEDVFYNSEKIREVVRDRIMPPWHGFLNTQFGELLNDKSIPENEIRMILGWIDAGGAKGDPGNAPEPREFLSEDAWSIGQPDYVYRMDQPFQVPATGTLDYQFFRVKLDFPEDRWFQAIEIKPGNPSVVHHITLHLVPADNRSYSGFLGMASLYGLNTQQARLLNDYLPGDTYNAKIHPAGEAVRIPAHSDLIFEIHYTPNGRAATDRSEVAFKWAPAAPQDEVLTSVFRRPVGRFQIPPHHPHFTVKDSFYFEHDVAIDTIRPHFHLRGKSYRLEIIDRDDTGTITSRTPVLTVPIYDFNWQRTYELATPLLLPAGTELLATAHFDNSSLNPNNPDPSATVFWGEQTTDEMFSTRFKYRVMKEHEREALTATLQRSGETADESSAR